MIGARYLRFNLRKLIICGALLFLLIASGSALIDFGKNDYVQDRLEKTVAFAKNPSLFFQTERWIWWSNSFQMLKDNPLGVGAGNWGFLYPVYRKYGKQFITRNKHRSGGRIMIICNYSVNWVRLGL